MKGWAPNSLAVTAAPGWALAVLACIAAVLAGAQQPNATGRLVVPNSGPIEGRLSGHGDQRELRFEAAAGIHLVVSVEGDGGMRATLVAPSGREEGGPAGIVFDDVLTETGHYTLRLAESPMQESWKGSFRVTISAR